jgi:hypothetical protein
MKTTDSDSAEMRPEYDFAGASRGRYSGRFYVDFDTPTGELVVLRRDLPQHGLREGDVGRLVQTDAAGGRIHVDFGMDAAREATRVHLAPGDLRLRRADEVLHVRSRRTG